jgi:hypothetical protein
MLPIIKALGGEEFLAQAFGRAYKRFHLEGMSGIFSWQDLNQLLGCHRLEAPRFRLAIDGHSVPMDEYCQRRTYRRMPPWNAPVPHLVAAQLRDGATLVLDAIDEMHPPIRAMAAALERQLRTSVQVNVYASWTTKEGFGVHWDDHDVVVVQLDGAKDWRIYGPTRPSPMFRDVVFDEEPPAIPIAEFTLHAGDGLYLPRGWWHAAATAPSHHSLHLTCGLTSHTGVNLLNWVIDELRHDVLARRDIPWSAEPAELKVWLADLRELLDRRFEDPDLIGAYRTANDAQYGAHHAFALPYAVAGTIPPSAVVRLAASRARVMRREGYAALEAAGRRWTVHPAAAPILEEILDGEPVTVSDLAERVCLPAEGVQALLAKFLAEGMLTVEAEGQAP